MRRTAAGAARPAPVTAGRRLAVAACALVLVACSSADEPAPAAGGAAPATSPPATSPPATSPPGSPATSAPGAARSERLTGTLGGVALVLEVADEPHERAVGLMRRTSVPPGTGMVFLYDEPSTGRFYMYDVPVPLRAVFLAQGRVVATVVMPPCEEPEPQDCPTYGADVPYDTVVETAPETLPDVRVGDVLELDR